MSGGARWWWWWRRRRRLLAAASPANYRPLRWVRAGIVFKSQSYLRASARTQRICQMRLNGLNIMRTERAGRRWFGRATVRPNYSAAWWKKSTFVSPRERKELRSLESSAEKSLMNDEGGNAFYDFCHCRPRLSKRKAIKPSSLLPNTRFAAWQLDCILRARAAEICQFQALKSPCRDKKSSAQHFEMLLCNNSNGIRYKRVFQISPLNNFKILDTISFRVATLMNLTIISAVRCAPGARSKIKKCTVYRQKNRCI